MPNRLLLDDSLFPIQVFPNAEGNTGFAHMVELITQGIGYSSNDCHCDFPSELEPDERRFEDVRFSIFEESIVIPRQKLRLYLEQAWNRFLKVRPEQRVEIERYLARH